MTEVVGRDCTTAAVERPAYVTNPQLVEFWDKHVGELCTLDPWPGTDEMKERHRLYAHLLMAITYHYWNGYKRWPSRDPSRYPLNDAPGPDDPPHLEGDYIGHNIAALAVDDRGYILDFDFNHNVIFNSSAEHAEARLVRRLYSLAQVSDSWGAIPSTPKTTEPAKPEVQAPTPGADRRKESGEHLGNTAGQRKYTMLQHVSIYTTLESCAQCSGVMALAHVKEVVYLQTDPGSCLIGRILANLLVGRTPAPRPISATEIGLACLGKLDAKFREFELGIAKSPFHVPAQGDPDKEPSLTSFLCTREARAIFREFGQLPKEGTLLHGTYQSTPKALTNDEVLAEAQDFLSYATSTGRRATPHNL